MSNTPNIRFSGFVGPWEQRKVKDIAPLQRGFDLPTSQMEDGGYPVVMSNGIGGQHSHYKVKGPGIVTGRSGTIGKLHYIEDDYWPHNTTLWVTDFYGNNQKFVYYMYQCLDLSRFSTGSGVPTLNRNDVHGELVCIPSLSEQEKISAYLTNLDHFITLNQRKCDEMSELKKFMLQKMFPKDGEQFPEIRFNGFTAPWKLRKLEEIYQKIRNAFVGTATPYYVDSGHFYLESNNVKDGQINRNTEVFINDEFYEKQKDNWLHTGDLVMVQSGHVGHTAVIPESLNNTAAHALIIIANPIEKISPYFVNYQFQTQNAKDSIDSITTGNTINHILASEIKRFEIVVPCFEEQSKIGEYFRQLDILITLHQRKLDELKYFKKFMLQNMFPKKG